MRPIAPRILTAILTEAVAKRGHIQATLLLTLLVRTRGARKHTTRLSQDTANTIAAATSPELGVREILVCERPAALRGNKSHCYMQLHVILFLSFPFCTQGETSVGL